MPRKKAVTPKSLLKAWIPLEQRARLDLHLVSELEGRVPLGKYSTFVEERLREFFDWVQLDLSLYGYPPGYFVRGPGPMILALKAKLEALRVQP